MSVSVSVSVSSSLVTALLLAGCASSPATLFSSRVALAPLMAKLEASGGNPAKVIRLHSEEELAGLKPGQRYKYVVTRDGGIVVAPRPASEPGNEYVHPLLAGGMPVRTAGYLRYDRRGATATSDTVVVDQDSKAYCPTFASLGEARAAFARIGVTIGRVRIEDHPPTCAPISANAGQDAGALDAAPPAAK